MSLLAPNPAPSGAAAVPAPGEAALAIRAHGLVKRYHLWKSPSARLGYSVLSQLHRTLRTVVERETPGLQAIARRRDTLGKDFFALQDINFEIRKGESVGIIGRNGSGKSTLLQIIVNTLRPTAGEVEIAGRVAAMLELGSGFNPEFTGRENAYLNALILGLTEREIDARLEAIVDFADLGVFIDEPVKTYSSGMVVRLGFAVLTQIDPEILIIDEALSVGDFLFQQKCFDTIRRFKERGCTLLFVSHAMATVLDLCERALLLDSGRLAFDGPARDAVNLYEASALRSRFQTGERPLQIQGAPPAATTRQSDPAAPRAAGNPPEPASPTRPATANGSAARPAPPPPPPTWARMSDPAAGRLLPVRPEQDPEAARFAPEKLRRLQSSPATAGTGPAPETDLGSLTSPDAALRFVRIYGQDGAERDWITSEEEMTLEIGILCRRALHDPHVGFKVRDRLGRVIFETSTLCMREPVGSVEAGEVLVTRFRYFLPILVGEYSITVGFANGGVGEADYAESLLYLHGVKTFQVYKNGAAIIWSGVCNLFPQVSFSRLDRSLSVMDALSREQMAQVTWRLLDCPTQAGVGEAFPARVEIANASDHAIHSGDPHPVHLSYRWKDLEAGEVVAADAAVRSALGRALAAGENGIFEARIVPPPRAGEFLLEIALVQEGIRWFDDSQGEALPERRVSVVGA